MELTQVPAGRAFTLAVQAAINDAKQGDPLRSVRVLVPSNIAGLSLRRMLGSRTLTDSKTVGPLGIANVSFSTPFQLASLLAAPRLAASGQRPLTTAVLAAAVRHVLATEPGRFGSVAEHVATESALIRAYAEITEMPPEHRRVLAGSTTSRTQDLLTFIDAVDQHLRSGTSNRYHDEYIVFSAAIDELGAAAPDEAFVLAGPFSQGLAAIEFLAALVEHSTASSVWAITGDADVDSAVRSQAELIVRAPVAVVEAPIPLPSTMLPTADPDEEVRAVVRSVLSAAERGVRFDRMAIFVPVRNPYLRTVREQLDSAGIPSAGPDHRTLADSMTGRLLNRLLQLADSGGAVAADKQFEREAVLALVEAAPLRGPDGRSVRSGPWENISRTAGVVAGIDHWAYRLNAHSESLGKRIVDNEADAAAGFLAGLERERIATLELAEFVSWLSDLTTTDAVGRSWSERSAWARQTLASLLPQENRRTSWPETEVDAAERVDKILARVGVLDEVEPNLTSSAFLRAIQLELDVPAGRRGRFGTGVLVAPLASAVGLDLDEVFILGLAEGICPRPIREDTLLPDAERKLVGSGSTVGALMQRSDHIIEERQRFLHAVSAGTSSTTLVSPRGDHRSGRERTASRWWVEAVRLLDGDPSVTSQSWVDSPRFGDLRLGSFDQSLTEAARTHMATSAADLQMQHVHVQSRFGVPTPEGVLAGPLRRGLELIATRLDGFNRFTGDLSGTEVRSPLADGKAISPSRLERWASCPRQFYFEQMLRLGEIERPEEIIEISALDKGNLWHQILEDFIRESLPGAVHEMSGPDYRWTDADRARLRAHADRLYAQYEQLGRTGQPILWAIRKEETNADLEAFLRSDNSLRTDLQSTPIDVELPFGLSGRGQGTPAAAAVVDIGDGRSIQLRGLIDRVDRRSDGVPVVLDYKTGKPTKQGEFDKDPVVGGQRLQLGVYAEAAAQHFKTDSAYAYYWYTSPKGDFTHAGYAWNADRKDRFVGAVRTIVDGIERGDFPPNPGDYDFYFNSFKNCAWCAFTRICPVDRDEEFEKAVLSGRLVDYVEMLEPPEADEDVPDQDGGNGE